MAAWGRPSGIKKGPLADGVRKGTVFRIAEHHGWKPQRRWRENGDFRGVFRIPEQHENIFGAM